MIKKILEYFEFYRVVSSLLPHQIKRLFLAFWSPYKLTLIFPNLDSLPLVELLCLLCSFLSPDCTTKLRFFSVAWCFLSPLVACIQILQESIQGPHILWILVSVSGISDLPSSPLSELTYIQFSN